MNNRELNYMLEWGECYHIEFKEQCANLDEEMLANAGLPPLRYDFSTFVRTIFCKFPESIEQAIAPTNDAQTYAILTFCASGNNRSITKNYQYLSI